MRIIIENGDVFDGTEAMLLECFGLCICHLKEWAKFHDWSYTIDDTVIWNDITEQWEEGND